MTRPPNEANRKTVWPPRRTAAWDSLDSYCNDSTTYGSSSSANLRISFANIIFAVGSSPTSTVAIVATPIEQLVASNSLSGKQGVGQVSNAHCVLDFSCPLSDIVVASDRRDVPTIKFSAQRVDLIGEVFDL